MSKSRKHTPDVADGQFDLFGAVPVEVVDLAAQGRVEASAAAARPAPAKSAEVHAAAVPVAAPPVASSPVDVDPDLAWEMETDVEPVFGSEPEAEPDWMNAFMAEADGSAAAPAPSPKRAPAKSRAAPRPDAPIKQVLSAAPAVPPKPKVPFKAEVPPKADVAFRPGATSTLAATSTSTSSSQHDVPAKPRTAASTPLPALPSAPRTPRVAAAPLLADSISSPSTRTLSQFAADRNDPVQPTGLRPLDDQDDLLRQLDLWVGRGWLRALDRAFVDLLHDIAPHTDSLVLLAAALTSHQLGHGHVCLDLAATLEAPDFALSLPPEGDALRNTMLPSQVLAGLTPEAWARALQGSELVAEGGDADASARPLVLAGTRLYLRRYWNYELSVAASLRDRLAEPLPVPADLPTRLSELFPDPPPAVEGEPVSDWQKVACALAARGRFSLITGGPGTGKTTTVVRLLAMLQSSAMAEGKPLRIRLAAPTGKAAARLGESIGVQLGQLSLDETIRKEVPTAVSTLHRLLGSRPDSRRFRHDRRHPLSLDVLVVDEASMIDLEMMASVLEALPASARLILLGDKDQLASVEAGAVLGDLCRDAELGNYRADTRAWLEAMTGAPLVDAALRPGTQALAQQTVMLRHSRRFGGGSGIGRLARAVNEQDAVEARAVFAQSPGDLSTLRVEGETDTRLLELIVDGGRSKRGPASANQAHAPQGYAHYLHVLRSGRPPADTSHGDPAWETWAAQVLAAFDEFRLLCSLRKGPWGVAGLNQRVADTLHARGLIRATDGWYEGRPVLSTRNDYGLGLMNGDIGIAMLVPTAEGPLALRVAFPRNDGQGGVRFVLPSRIGAVETVFAMTVHKSQGSEFAHTALVLPPALNPVLTKELVYTGITRARQWFTLVESGAGVFDAAVARQVRRLSGLSLHLDAT
jgi:exodeoxyribonuclease V alpha subunit